MQKILIVEDEYELALNIQEILINLDYEVVGIFNNAIDVLDFFIDGTADLILMDILINGDLDGIDLCYKLKDKLNIPIVFLTAYSDQGILDRISKVIYDGYLLKPFTVESLKSSIYLALEKPQGKSTSKPASATKNTLKIRDKGFLVPVPVYDILFLKADGLYTKVFTKTKTYVIRDILKDVLGDLPTSSFVRVHKSYLVNIKHISSFNSKELIIEEHTIPIRRGFYKELHELTEIK
ncbi:two component transcriptional regulator, LytTR family [Belliella buryatensis]|uniref:Two component transcriptional regulator, LytTR family n=1 Tax=Belliella buryatensis TaxID=1500549 RepID=A0A239DXC9_9BACT|nr:LytTR family transcriptional regulator DNA-binding domain-containing protein [Belliella buryatensis]SNS36362.1 two component transcriptional regulator, LytTR family [Belliella buryatensis]